MGKKNTRPPLVPRETRKTKAKADAELDQGIELTFEGETYTVRVGDVSPALARELRQQTGHGFLELFNAMHRSPDVDLVSAWIWLARRVQGEHVELAEIDAQVSYAAVAAAGLEAKPVEGPGDDEGPEA